MKFENHWPSLLTDFKSRRGLKEKEKTEEKRKENSGKYKVGQVAHGQPGLKGPCINTAGASAPTLVTGPEELRRDTRVQTVMWGGWRHMMVKVISFML